MLDKYDELEFVNQLSLPRSKRVPSGLNFECPFCLEGKSKGRKRRGFLLLTSPTEGNTFYCHNCHKSLSFKNFLKEFNISIYQDYLEKEKSLYIEKLKKGQVNAKQKKIAWDVGETKIKFFTLNGNYFFPVEQNKQALLYCQKRKIPNEYIEKLYYVENSLPSQYVAAPLKKELETLRGMVVFPFYSPKGIYGYQGRSIEGKRFHTRSQPGHKIYNIFNIDPDKRVYIFESIIDSLFLDNSIALLGSSLGDSAHIEKLKDRVYVLDNDRTEDTFNQMEKLIDAGERIVIWPDNLDYLKDINEAVLYGPAGGPKQNAIVVQIMLGRNIYSGFEAQVKLKMLKLKKKKK